MKSFWHYLTDYSVSDPKDTGSLGNRESYDLPLMVNCAGRISTADNTTNSVSSGRLDYYLLYVISGKIKVDLGNGYTEASENTLMIVPPKCGYKHTVLGKSGEVNYLWVHFTGSEIKERLEKYGIELFPAINETNPINNISNRFQKLFEGFARNDKFRDSDLSALLDRLLIEIGRAIFNKRAEKISLSKSLRYINEFYTSNIKITELAKIENMCMTSYNLHFKKQMGIAPTKYIIRLRMDSAKDLLKNSNLSISEISAMCGYNDYNFFSRAFKSVNGISPTEYRKKTQ